MLGMSLAMLLGGVLLMLRLSPGGSFPSRFRRRRNGDILYCGREGTWRQEMCLLSTIYGS